MTPILTSSLYLYQCLSEGRHDVGWILAAQSSYDTYGHLSYLVNLIIKCDKQCTQVLGLGKVGVKSVVKGDEYTVTDVGV